MRLACLCLAIACALVILAPPVYPQTMLEYGVTAAGGSAMGVAGRGVSDSIDSIFRKLDQQTKEATATDQQPRRLQPQPEVDAATSAEPAPGPSAAQARGNLATAVAPSLPALTREWGNSAVWNVAIPEPEAPAPTREDLEAVETGQARDEVVARLGAPAARVIIPEAGHLQEVYLYSSRTTHLGKVTLIDGAVSSVRVQ